MMVALPTTVNRFPFARLVKVSVKRSLDRPKNA
jgi:hypothetical protein